MLFDLVMALTFGFIGWRAAATLLRQRPLMREAGLSLVLVPIALLFPIAHVAAAVAGLVAGTTAILASVTIVCATPYLAAWLIARRQADVLQRTGTRRAETAQEAVASVHGFAMLGFGLVVGRVAIVSVLAAVHPT